jgi:hypothetical protein
MELKNERKGNFEESMLMGLKRERGSLSGIMVKNIKGNFIKI